MASTTKKRSTNTKQAAAATLICPECGRSFTRPQGLGAHRRQAHGVVGTSLTATRRNAATATKRRRRRATSTITSAAAATTRTRARATSTRSRPTASTRNGSGNQQGANRDALLQTLFPAGIPAREAVIQAINDWLQEAERLARMR
jgi:hypothetical protein